MPKEARSLLPFPSPRALTSGPAFRTGSGAEVIRGFCSKWTSQHNPLCAVPYPGGLSLSARQPRLTAGDPETYMKIGAAPGAFSV